MRLLALRTIITSIIVILISAPLTAGTITTSFGSNPFGVWCERFHDVSWNSGAQRIDVQGSTLCAGNPCCTCGGANCSSAQGNSGFLITKASQEPTTSGRNRTASVKWAFATGLVQATGEHPTLYVVAHPNCHAGVQSYVFREGSQYRLYMAVTDDFLAGFDDAPDYCGGLAGLVQIWSSSNTTALTLQSTPRYITNLHARLTGLPPSLGGIANATLVDSATGTTLLSIGNKSFTSGVWFDGAAKRYGIGGVRAPGDPIKMDDFSGVSF